MSQTQLEKAYDPNPLTNGNEVQIWQIVRHIGGVHRAIHKPERFVWQSRIVYKPKHYEEEDQ